jgi:DNA repair ATPase RecN
MEVEDRMSLIYSLMQKHSCREEAELIALRDSLSEALFDSTQLEEKREELAGQLSKMMTELEAVASRLNDARCKHAGEFAVAIQESIR